MHSAVGGEAAVREIDAARFLLARLGCGAVGAPLRFLASARGVLAVGGGAAREIDLQDWCGQSVCYAMASPTGRLAASFENGELRVFDLRAQDRRALASATVIGAGRLAWRGDELLVASPRAVLSWTADGAAPQQLLALDEPIVQLAACALSGDFCLATADSVRCYDRAGALRARLALSVAGLCQLAAGVVAVTAQGRLLAWRAGAAEELGAAVAGCKLWAAPAGDAFAAMDGGVVQCGSADGRGFRLRLATAERVWAGFWPGGAGEEPRLALAARGGDGATELYELPYRALLAQEEEAPPLPPLLVGFDAQLSATIAGLLEESAVRAAELVGAETARAATVFEQFAADKLAERLRAQHLPAVLGGLEDFFARFFAAVERATAASAGGCAASGGDADALLADALALHLRCSEELSAAVESLPARGGAERVDRGARAKALRAVIAQQTQIEELLERVGQRVSEAERRARQEQSWQRAEGPAAQGNYRRESWPGTARTG